VRRRPRLLPALLLVMVVLLGSSAVASGQSGTTTPTVPVELVEDDPAAARIGPQGDPGLVLTDQDSWIGPRGTFRMDIAVVTPGEDYELQARLFQAVSSEEQILAANENVPGSKVLDRFVRKTVPAGTTNHRLEVPVVPEADGTFGDPYVLEPGIYPIGVTLLDPDGEVVASMVTHLVHLPASLLTTPTPVAVIAEFDHAPERGIDGRAKLSAATASTLEQRLDALSRFTDVPVTLQLQPETVSALIDTRAGVGGPALSGLIRLAGLGGPSRSEILGGTYVAFDEAAWIADQHADWVRRELDAGVASLTAASLRSSADTAALYGPAEPTVLARLAEAGVDRVVAARPRRLDGRAPAEFGTGPAPLADRADQLLLPAPAHVVTPAPATTAATGTTGLDALDAHRLIAALLVDDVAGSARPHQIRLGARLDLGGSFSGTLLAALAAPGPLRPVTLSALFDEPGRPAVAQPAVSTTPPGRSEPRSGALAKTGLRVGGLGAMLGEDVLADTLRARLLLVPAAQITDTAASAIVADVEATVSAVTASVVVPDSQAFTTTSHETSIPLVVRNETDGPLQIELVLASGELDFIGDNPRSVVLQPGANDLEIPIKTRRSGEFAFQVRVTSPDGSITLGDIQVRVQSRAISGVGLFLSGGALAFLVVWWFRNARRHRRLRHEARSRTLDDHPDDSTTDLDRNLPATAVPSSTNNHRGVGR